MELCGAKIIQFVRRGSKPTPMLPHLALQHCECAMAISNLPSTRILIPSVFKTCSWEDAAHWMVPAFLMLAALAQTKDKEDKRSLMSGSSWNRCISADSEIPCFLALYKALSSVGLLPSRWKSPWIDGEITTEKSAKSRTKCSAEVFLPHFSLSPTSDWYP